MKLLFLTQLNTDICHEHIFNKDVWHKLSHGMGDIVLSSILFYEGIKSPKIEETTNNNRPYYKLLLPKYISDVEYLDALTMFFLHVSPDLIHSNVMETYKIIEAAKKCKIPIIITIHVGGIICPKGGMHSFLTNKDNICNTPVSKNCLPCCCGDLSIHKFAEFIIKLVPEKKLLRTYNRIKGKNILYITPLLNYVFKVNNWSRYRDMLQYATIIAANNKLVELLQINGLTENVRLIPHGVVESSTVSPVEIKKGECVKFFYSGRVEYAKGVHVILEALKGIDINRYEMHIIGPCYPDNYAKKLRKMAKNLNVKFHGIVSHDETIKLMSNFHVMIHSAMCLEVYGLSISESLMMKRPVLATRCGGAEMQVEDGVNGWLIEPNNVKEMHDKICALIDDPQQIVETSKHCRLPHSMNQYVSNLENLYKEVLGKVNC